MLLGRNCSPGWDGTHQIYPPLPPECWHQGRVSPTPGHRVVVVLDSGGYLESVGQRSAHESDTLAGGLMLEGRQGGRWTEFVDGVGFILRTRFQSQPYLSFIEGRHYSSFSYAAQSLACSRTPPSCMHYPECCFTQFSYAISSPAALLFPMYCGADCTGDHVPRAPESRVSGVSEPPADQSPGRLRSGAGPIPGE